MLGRRIQGRIKGRGILIPQPDDKAVLELDLKLKYCMLEERRAEVRVADPSH